MADKNKPLTLDDLPAPSGDLSADSLPEPPAAATPPTMQAAPPETLGQRASAIWNSPIPGLTAKSPKEIGTELLHGAEMAVPAGMMAGPVMTEGLGATALGAARGIAGASGGAYLGRRGGEELGRLVGAPELGGKVGGVLGSIAGGYGAIKSPEMIEGYLGRLLGKPASGVGVVGSAAQEAGYEPPVLKIPEPTGPKMIRAEQVPGPDTAGKGNLLTPAAVRGEEGAGKELMGRGRNVLYTVPEYEGTTPKMKMTFPPNASGESEASLEAINRGKAEKLGGIKRFAVDSRSGVRRRVYGADQTPNPYEHIIRSGPDGEYIETSGSKARPYNPR